MPRVTNAGPDDTKKAVPLAYERYRLGERLDMLIDHIRYYIGRSKTQGRGKF